MDCVIEIDLERMAPRPMPGKTYMLLPVRVYALALGKRVEKCCQVYDLPCPGVRVLLLYVTGSNGLPLANSTRPSVHSTASSKLHSDWEEGFDKGKMTGLSLSSAMRLRIFLSKAPPIVDRPMRIVGLTSSTTS